jgi:hypothetical protein
MGSGVPFDIAFTQLEYLKISKMEESFVAGPEFVSCFLNFFEGKLDVLPIDSADYH